VCAKAKDTPKEKWAISKFKQYMQGQGQEDMNKSDGDDSLASDQDDSSVCSSSSQCLSHSSACRSGGCSVGFGNFCFEQTNATEDDNTEVDKCFIEKLFKELGKTLF
jgi:hypothetical protein